MSAQQLIHPESLELAARAAYEDWKAEMARHHIDTQTSWEDEREGFIQTARVAITVWCEAGGITLADDGGSCQPVGATNTSGVLPAVPDSRALPAGRVSCRGLVVDLASRVVTYNGDVVHGLRRKEYELLVCLIREPSRVYTRQWLLSEVWGDWSGSRSRTVDSHAGRLRATLSAAGATGFVRNVWGVGYMLSPPESEAHPPKGSMSKPEYP